MKISIPLNDMYVKVHSLLTIDGIDNMISYVPWSYDTPQTGLWNLPFLEMIQILSKLTVLQNID